MFFYPAHVRHLAVREFRSHLRVARHLTGNAQEKRKLRKALSPHLHLFADASVRHAVAKANWLCVCLLVGLTAGIAAPALVFSGSGPLPDGYAYAFVTWYLAMLALLSVALRSKRRGNGTAQVGAVNLQLLGLLAVLVFLPSAGHRLSFLNAAAVSSLACLTAVAVLFTPRFLIYRFTPRQQYLDVKRQPETAFVFELLAACELLAASEQRWHFVEPKRAFMSRIETAAVIAETHLPASMWVKGADVNARTAEHCRGMAGGLREMQAWMVAANSRTHPRLKKRLCKTLCGIGSGEWGEVRFRRPARPRRSLDGLMRFLGRAGAVLLALAMLYVSRQPQFTRSIPLELRTLVWVAVVSLLTLAFPRLGEYAKPGKLLADLLLARKPKDP